VDCGEFSVVIAWGSERGCLKVWHLSPGGFFQVDGAGALQSPICFTPGRPISGRQQPSPPTPGPTGADINRLGATLAAISGERHANPPAPFVFAMCR